MKKKKNERRESDSCALEREKKREREREGGAHLVLARACMQAEQRLPRPSYNKRNEQRSSSAGNNPTQPLHFQEKETERRERRREKRERETCY